MTSTVVKPLDSLPMRLVDGAPAAVQPYLRLMRLDRPIGSWLLFWPCIFGLALGAVSTHHRLFSAPRDWLWLALFAAGTILMRGAGCTYNDIIDRDFDAAVARTRARPIACGAVSRKQAAIFLGGQLLLSLLILLQFNRFAIEVGIASTLLVLAYPFMKRITWWPQAWLGLTFNWGVLLGCAAEAGQITAPALAVYAAGLFWTLGYDTIYALQDVEDDALVGVKSTARLFGRRAPIWVLLFYALTMLCLAIGGVAAGLGRPFAWMLLFPGLHLLWQVLRLKIEQPQTCLALFRANRDAGALIALAMVLGTWAIH